MQKFSSSEVIQSSEGHPKTRQVELQLFRSTMIAALSYISMKNIENQLYF